MTEPPEYCEHGRMRMVWCDDCYEWAEWVIQAKDVHDGPAL